jgi:protein involved in polysaccharide export with SLBB domain
MLKPSILLFLWGRPPGLRGTPRSHSWLFPLICLHLYSSVAILLAQEAVPSNYILGPDDQITLFVANLDEASNKPMRIDRRGDLNIPLAGRIHAAGLTPDQLESQIETRLKKQLNDPNVAVPGVHQLEGRITRDHLIYV